MRVEISYSQDSRFRQLFVVIIPFFFWGTASSPFWTGVSGKRGTAQPPRLPKVPSEDVSTAALILDQAGSLRVPCGPGWGPALRRRFRRFQSHRHRQEAGVLVGAVNLELVEFFSERLKVDTTNSQMLFQIFHESEPSLVPGMRPWKDVLQHFFFGDRKSFNT